MKTSKIFLHFFSFFFFLIFLVSCSNDPLFKLLDSKKTGVNFNNKIELTAAYNPINLEFIYNGGGVAVGDFDLNGLPDLYFTGNMVSNELYLNKGKLQFENCTKIAGVGTNNFWSSSASVVDINNDGKPDIYVSNTVKEKGEDRKNLLFVNQGVNGSGVPTFKEMAAEYQLADTSHSVMTSFFDYDNDGDLDAYILTTQPIQRAPTVFQRNDIDTVSYSMDKLLRNDFDSSLGHAVFTDVSKEAGIDIPGYGLGVNITDINHDGWKDIFVTNDFNNSDHLYVNQKNGTFKEASKQYFKHGSYNAMGNDVVDLNNDGLQDIVTVDMNAKDSYRKKMNMNPNSYQGYINQMKYNYNLQYVRNTLQLNQGFTHTQREDSSNHPVFSEIGFLAGIAETDWSWCPSVADFDNDGKRDIIITNGYPRDVTDNDFISYRQDFGTYASWETLLEKIPQIKIANYAFKNNGQLSFEDVTKSWGMDLPTFSNGAVYVDLDKDGDLDYVVNNINDLASVYENNQNKQKEVNSYLQIKLEGNAFNKDGFGAEVLVYYNNGQFQYYEHTPYRGYLSSVDPIAHFGLGQAKQVDSIKIIWPDHQQQMLKNVAINQQITLNHKASSISSNDAFAFLFHTPKSMFTNLSTQFLPSFVHEEADYVDFNVQKLLPHKLSEYGPGIAVGDINVDGLDDFVMTGSYPNAATLFFQEKTGKYSTRPLIDLQSAKKEVADEMSPLLFDADNDGDLDLYITRGGYERSPKSSAYQDQFFTNNGKGIFTLDTLAIPSNLSSKSCVRAADFDRDGDLDLFLAGRVEPWAYPKSVSSFIYRNDSKNGKAVFTDITKQVAPGLNEIGLICDAIFTDFDNDGWQDLILVGEWMSVEFLKNNAGKFANVTKASNIDQQTGFWSSITAADVDKDGDMDYVVGNMGLNSFYKASEKYPAQIYASDFNKDGNFDAIPVLYLKTSFDNPKIQAFPAHTRDDMIKQMINMRAKFPNYNSYAKSTINEILTKEELKTAIVKKATNFASSILMNEGGGKFSMTSLPIEAQFSNINGIVTEDFNADGNIDLLLSGNDYGTEVSVGRYDASNGLLLKGDGKGHFKHTSIMESGIFIPGNAKALVKLLSASGKYQVVASQNRGNLVLHQLDAAVSALRFNQNDIAAILYYKNGQKQKIEIPFGSSFLSASSRFININSSINKIELLNHQGKKRIVKI